MDEEVKESLRIIMQDQRMNGSGLNRFGIVYDRGNVGRYNSEPCFASLLTPSTRTAYIFSSWQGESLYGTKSSYSDRHEPYTKRSSFMPGPKSDRWLEYLLSDESHFKDIHEYLIEKDAKVIRETGFIIDAKKCPYYLLMNFLIATRFHYEFPLRCDLWLRMMDEKGLEPRVAYLVAMGWKSVAKKEIKVIEEGGFVRDPADRRRKLLDDNGNPVWKDAVIEELVDYSNETFINLSSDPHCALPSVNGYARRVLSQNPRLDSNPYAEHRRVYGNNSWDIFITGEDIVEHRSYYHRTETKPLESILEFINEHK